MNPKCLLLAAAISAALPAIAADPLYSIVKSIPLGSPERWDYVAADRATHRVYIAHGPEVTVVDPVAGKVIAQIGPYPGGTHGITFARNANRGYTDDGGNGLAEVFNLATLQPEGSVPAQPGADGVAFDDATQRVFVISGRSGKITVIDSAKNQVAGTIDVGTDMEAGAVDRQGKFYVNGAKTNQLIRIDIATNKIDARYPLAGCNSPSGLAIDRANRVLFSTCRNGVMVVINGATGQQLATLPIGQGTDTAMFDPVRKRAFSSNGRDGTITVVQEQSPTSFAVIGTVKTQVTGRTMAVDPATGWLYVAAAQEKPGFKPPSAPQGGPPAGGAPNGPPLGGPRLSNDVPGSLKLLVLKPAG